MTNVEIIREIGNSLGWNHTNGFFQDIALEKYGRAICSQQIQKVCGLRKDRKWIGHEHIVNCCKNFLRSCDYDFELARRVLANTVKSNAV